MTTTGPFPGRFEIVDRAGCDLAHETLVMRQTRRSSLVPPHEWEIAQMELDDALDFAAQTDSIATPMLHSAGHRRRLPVCLATSRNRASMSDSLSAPRNRARRLAPSGRSPTHVEERADDRRVCRITRVSWGKIASRTVDNLKATGNGPVVVIRTGDPSRPTASHHRTTDICRRAGSSQHKHLAPTAVPSAPPPFSGH